ncbi:hypothetical protein PRIPAC_75330 [Pristionchus pacificus]|uniref:Protein kinase domain-containing protein n=1 Tax=Pristionchus pacificus TaxID=54126 RepID=A0A2A6CRS0_PRIPA|nr:hypothetical protein PRIPAC_75330 [Pristionchus pacificus]|eukprot:PDM80914.1 protein kinase [Pristionchus pacificus]
MVGIVHNTWKDTQSKEFYADCKVYAKMKEYLENEYARSIDYCKDVAGIVLQYCKEAIDRSLEAGTPVFDELKSWSENTISITVDSFDKINKKVIEQLSAQSMGNCHLNDQMNFSLTRMNYSKQELKFGLLRKQRVELDQYRIEERRQANDRYLSRFAEHEDRTIEKRYFNNENGLITSMIDRDLSECRLQPIGKGAQGTVYSLHLDGLKVVAKRFRSEKDRKEIANLCRVSNHPNILKMICRGYCGDEWFLVVEYCPLSLADELRRRRSSDSRALSKEEFAKWISQLAKGMKYLHGHIVELGADIYHGDLKPENILIAGDGTFKIADFGASQLMDYSAWFDEKKSMSGTPRYMAPELHRREIDIKNLKKADVWSWAVVVWEMMVNHSPYSGMDQRLLPVLIGRDSIHPPIPSGTIESLENLLRRCWNPTPVLRPSFRGIVRDVDDVIAEINAMNEEWMFRRAAVLCLLLVAAEGFLFGSGCGCPPPPPPCGCAPSFSLPRFSLPSPCSCPPPPPCPCQPFQPSCVCPPPPPCGCGK